MQRPQLHATLWPEFSHFNQFQNDSRMAGIRLNSAMAESDALGQSVERLSNQQVVPWYVDFKGRQPRVEEVIPDPHNLVLRLNHPIETRLPVGVAFKAEKDFAILDRLEENGRKLIFRGGPNFNVRKGESLHIKDPSFKIRIPGSIFSDQEKEKIAAVVGRCDKYYLSYVETQRDVDEFRELVGPDAFIWLKIETRDGLEYIANTFRKTDNVGLVAARGDLYIEVSRHHEILNAMKLIISKDPEAMAASRIFLSLIGYKNPLVSYLLGLHPEDQHDPRVQDLIKPSGIPECHDFEELAWLYDLGYRNYLLCDEICLDGELLDIALSAFEAFADYYHTEEQTTANVVIEKNLHPGLRDRLSASFKRIFANA